MYKIGICGHYGENQVLLNGQTIRTKTLTEQLKAVLGSDKIQTLDTYGWKKKPINLLFKCCLLIRDCKNIIILPAHNGVKIIVPLFLILNRLLKRKLHYVVIGGWLPEFLEKKQWLINSLKKFDGIYVQTYSMVRMLQRLGLQNARYFPNFKRLEILDESELVYPTGEPYKLCTFSRVTKEKGIEDAINAVKYVNNDLGRIVYTLDIYGQVDGSYSERFEKLKNSFPNYISYKGVVGPNESVKVLKNYLALLFPTYYEGEGFAGTILDAFASGVPVIATNWRYNGEIVNDKSDGLLYDYKKNNQLQNILLEIYRKPNTVTDMKKNCIARAKEYLPETVIGELIRHLE